MRKASWHWVTKSYGTRGGSVSHGTPFVARLSPAGEVVWLWQFDANTIVGGAVNGVTVDAQGNVYSVSTEDPTTDPTRRDAVDPCTVYGCDGMVVRKFARDGRPLWEYQHRSAYSTGLAIALDTQGRVVAAGEVTREDTRGLVLRFSPD